MPSKLIAPLEAVQTILANYNRFINKHVTEHLALENHSPTELANEMLWLENTKLETGDHSTSLVHAGEILKELNPHDSTFQQTAGSIASQAWNQYMYHFLKEDFLQKAAFLLNHSDCFDETDKAIHPDLKKGMDFLISALKEAKKMLDMLLDADNPKAKAKEKILSNTLREQLNEISEAPEFVEKHLELVFKEINLHINHDYNRMNDLEGPMIHADPEQVEIIKRVLHYMHYPVELMTFIMQHDDIFRVSDAFKACRIEMLATHADALRNLGFQLYEEKPNKASHYLSRASQFYEILLSLDPHDSAASKNKEICENWIKQKDTSKKKGTKRHATEMSNTLIDPHLLISPAQKRHHGQGFFDGSAVPSSSHVHTPT